MTRRSSRNYNNSCNTSFHDRAPTSFQSLEAYRIKCRDLEMFNLGIILKRGGRGGRVAGIIITDIPHNFMTERQQVFQAWKHTVPNAKV